MNRLELKALSFDRDLSFLHDLKSAACVLAGLG